jgi:hypothetical protein
MTAVRLQEWPALIHESVSRLFPRRLVRPRALAVSTSGEGAMLKRRVLGVLLGAVVLVLAMMAPVGAVDPPAVTATITMPDGSVHVIDTVSDINIISTDRGPALIIRTNGAVIEGYAGFAMFVQTPAGGGGDVCTICL